MAVQVLLAGLYTAPVFKAELPLNPPQTTTLLAVQTMRWSTRALGAEVVVIAVQTFDIGLYRDPWLVITQLGELDSAPPQTIISEPVQTSVEENADGGGEPVVPAADQIPAKRLEPARERNKRANQRRLFFWGFIRL